MSILLTPLNNLLKIFHLRVYYTTYIPIRIITLMRIKMEFWKPRRVFPFRKLKLALMGLAGPREQHPGTVARAGEGKRWN